MAFNPRQYVKNVGKSFGYSVIDSLKTYNPQIASLADGAKEFSSDLKDSIDEMRSNRRNSDPNAEKSLFGIKKSTVTNIRDNLIDDLKTGNWYNKEREDQAGMKMAESMMGFSFDDFDMDFDDFDDEDMFEDDDVNEPVSAADAPALAAQARSAEAIIDSMDMVGSKSATAISNATVQSADYVVAAVGEGNRALYSLEQRGFMQMSQGLAAINDNIQVIGTIAEPLTKHMQNSAMFYTQSAEYQKSVLEKLDIIIKNTTVEEPKQAQSKRRLTDFMNGTSFDLFGYLGYVQENAKNRSKDNDMGMDINSMLNMVFANPMKDTLNKLTNSLIPEVTKTAMEEFNKTLASFIPTMIDSLQHEAKSGGALGSLINSLNDILFPPDRLKQTLDTSKYNHGKVNWTGEAEMALKEVIPTYLAAITSALTGNPMTVYDYKKGAFVTKGSVEEGFRYQKESSARRAGGDFRSDIIASIRGSDLSQDQKDALISQLDTFLGSAFEQGGYSVSEFRKGERSASSFGVSEDFGNFLMDAFRSYEKNNRRGTSMSVSSDIRSERDNYNRRLERMEAENGAERSLFNGSSNILGNGRNGGGLFGTDQYGHDVFFYLQDLWKSNWYLADNIALFGSGNGGGKSSGGQKTNKYSNYIIGGDTSKNINPVRDLRNANERDRENTSNMKSGPRSNGSVSNEDLANVLNNLNESLSPENSKRLKKERSLSDVNNEMAEMKKAFKRDHPEYSDKEINDALHNDKDYQQLVNRKQAINKEYADDKTFGVIADRVNDILATPGQVVADVLNAGQKALYDLIFGKEDENGEKQGGLFHYFYTQADNLFSHFNDFFNQKAKATMSQWMNWLVNGSLEDLRDDVVNNFKSAGRWVTGKISNFLGFGKKGNKGEGETEPIGNAAYGRRVTKTGVIAVSEGELIIPSEYNPFYHGTNNKSTQLRNERNAARQFYGNFAEGGTVGGKEDEEEMSFAKILNDSIAKLGEGFGRFFAALFPKDEEEQEDETNKLFSLHTAKALKDANLSDEIHKNSGAMLTGGAIGAGVSILSGCLVGPIAGAAIGAGVGLIAKSDSLQKALFGDVELDDKGNAIGRTGNILSKDMSDFITQKLPNAAVATGVGAAAGLFMGSPILGAFLGGTISFAAQSETVRKTLFGEMDEEGNRQGGLISKELQDKLKKAAPNMGAGALGGLLATALGGPFGLAGNLVVGTAIGYASTSEKFQEAVLGKVGEDGKRTGGIVGEFRGYFFGYTDDTGRRRQGIIESVVGIFDKVGDEIRVRARDIFKDTAQNLRGAIDRAASSTLGQWFGGTRLGRAAGGIARTARRVVNAPFQFAQDTLEGIDVRLGRRALRQGRNLRNSKGQRMTAEERAQWAKEHDMKGYETSTQGAIDRMISGLSSQEDIDALNEQLAMIEDPRAQTDREQKKASTRFAYMLEDMGIDSKTATDLNHLAVGESNGRLRRGKITDLDSFFAAHPEIEGEDRDRITNEFNNVQNKVKEGSDAQKNADEAAKALAERLGVGEDEITRDTVRNIRDREQAEQDRNNPKKKSEEEKTDTEKILDKIGEIKDSIVENKGATVEVKDKFTEIYDDAKGWIGNKLDAIETAILFLRGKNPDGSSILNGDEGMSGPATKICPICGAEVLASATECDECGYKFPSVENNELNKIINAPKTSDIVNPGAHATESTSKEESEEDEGDKKTVFDSNGNPIQQVKNNQGEWVPDTSDRETVENIKSNKSMRDAMMSLPLIGPAIGGLSKAFSKLFGGGDEDSSGGGFFSNLFDKFFGENSIIGFIGGAISKLFGGSGSLKIGAGIKSALSGFGTLLKDGLLVTGLVAAFSGVFDDLVGNIINAITGKNSMTDNTVITAENGETGEEEPVLVDPDTGEPIRNADGNLINTKGEEIPGTAEANLTTSGKDTSLSQQMVENTITGITTGNGSLATGVIKTVTGVDLSRGAITAGLADVAASGMNSDLITGILQSITHGLNSIASVITKCPLIPQSWRESFAANADVFIAEVANAAKTNLGKKASSALSSIASVASTALTVVRVVTLVATAVDAWTGAEAILGVKEATTGERFVATLVAVVNAMIPFIGNILPNKTIVDLGLTFANLLGIDTSGIDEQRAELQAEVDAYNEEWGTDIDAEAWLEMNGKVGVVTNLKHKASDFVNNVKENGLGTTLANTKVGQAVTNFGSNVVEGAKNLGSNVVEGVKNFGSNVAEGAKNLGGKVVDTATSIRDNIVEGVTGFFDNTKEKITGGVEILKEGVMNKILSIGDIVQEEKDYMDKFIKDEDADWKDMFKIEDDPENPMGSMVKVFRMAIRIGYSVFVIGKKIFNTISKKVNEIVDTVKQGFTTYSTNQAQLDSIARTGDINGVLNFTYQGDENNILNGVLKTVSGASKVLYVPMAAIHWVGNKVSEVIDNAFNTVKEGFNAFGTSISEVKDYAFAGDTESLNAYTWNDIEDNPLNGIFSGVFGVAKLGFTAVGAVVNVGKAISTAISEAIDKVKQGYSNLTSGVDELSGYAKEGDLDSINGAEYEKVEGDPLGGLFNFAFGVSRLFYTPVGAFHKIANVVGDFMTSKIDAAKNDYTTLSNTASTMSNLADNGDISGVWNSTYKPSEDNIIGPLFSGIFQIQKLFYAIGAIGKSIFGTVGDFIDGVIGGVKNIGSTIAGGVSDFVGGIGETIDSAVQGISTGVKEWLNEDEEEAENEINEEVEENEEEEEEVGAGSGIRSKLAAFKGAGSGDNEDFVSQYDNKYKNMKFGNSTIENLGCGPAAATMIVNTTRPGTTNMRDSIKLAEKFESPEGTSADYFQYALGQYGMPTNYIDSTTNQGQEELETELARGQTAILLGRDNENTDKKFSPFGPNSHYIVATGVDNNGNLIINDPEASKAGIKYSPDILQNVSLGITSEMTPAAIDNYRSEVGSGVNVQDTDYARAVWAYLTTRGYSPQAAAGILGNMYQESGVNPTIIQGNGKGPAAGIVQWENYNNKSKRWGQMNEYAQSIGKDWTDLDTQLKFMDAEFTGEFKNEIPQAETWVANLVKKRYGSIEGYKNLNDINEATKGFEETFEQAGKPAMENRYSAANAYYSLYNGSEYTGAYDPSMIPAVSSSYGTATGTASSTDSSSSGLMGILQAITSAFASAFAPIIGGSQSSTSAVANSILDSGLSSLNGPGGEGNEQQKQLVNVLKPYIGKLNYSMSGPRNPEAGSADCSSTVNWAYKKVVGDSIGDDTPSILNSSKTTFVDVPSPGISKENPSSTSAGPNINNLEPGDLMLYTRYNSSSGFATGRPYAVGHVEMYTGEGQKMGHGSTPGPKVSAYNDDASRYIGAKRYNKFIEEEKNAANNITAMSNEVITNNAAANNTSGTYYTNQNVANQAAKGVASGSGLGNVHMPSVSKLSMPASRNGSKFRGYSGGASGDEQTETLQRATTRQSTNDQSLIVSLLRAIARATQAIADNTTDIPTLGTTLTNYCKSQLSTSITEANAAAQTAANSTNSNKVNPEDDPALQELMYTMGEIAKG